MKITKVETFQIETPRYYGQISGHVIVKVHVDEGPIGLGEASDSKADDVGAIAKRYNELLVGRDATRITEINESLRAQNFGSTVSNLHLASAIDLALYDLNGKVQGVPVYQMLGGKMRDSVYCCYPIFGWQVTEDFEKAAGYLQTVGRPRTSSLPLLCIRRQCLGRPVPDRDEIQIRRSDSAQATGFLRSFQRLGDRPALR